MKKDKPKKAPKVDSYNMSKNFMKESGHADTKSRGIGKKRLSK